MDPGAQQRPPYGSHTPDHFNGSFVWKWNGGDPTSIGGEHRQALTVNVALEVEADWAGDFHGSATYQDSGSTFTYDGTVTHVTPPAPGLSCSITDTHEGHGTGPVSKDGQISGALQYDDVLNEWGMILYLDVRGFTDTDTSVSTCTGTQTETVEGGAPDSLCDKVPDHPWGTWQWDVDSSVSFGCVAGDITETGKLVAN